MKIGVIKAIINIITLFINCHPSKPLWQNFVRKLQVKRHLRTISLAGITRWRLVPLLSRSIIQQRWVLLRSSRLHQLSTVVANSSSFFRNWTSKLSICLDDAVNQRRPSTHSDKPCRSWTQRRGSRRGCPTIVTSWWLRKWLLPMLHKLIRTNSVARAPPLSRSRIQQRPRNLLLAKNNISHRKCSVITRPLQSVAFWRGLQRVSIDSQRMLDRS